MSAAPPYLSPYLSAARRHGAGFDSLLWASPKTQELRFDALIRSVDLDDRVVLDVGCGRGDLIDFLEARRVGVKKYVGIEAVEQLANAAKRKCGESVTHPYHGHPARADIASTGRMPVVREARIVVGDFVREPTCIDVGADVIVFSGSLNTLDTREFYASLSRAFAAASRAVAFNFLCSPLLAGRSYLNWHARRDVAAFARTLSRNVHEIEDYLKGDCTFAIEKMGSK